MRTLKLALAAAVLSLAACSSLGEGSDLGVYSLVRVKPTNVGNGSVIVEPPRPWNRQRRFFFFDSVRWSRTGPQRPLSRRDHLRFRSAER